MKNLIVFISMVAFVLILFPGQVKSQIIEVKKWTGT